MQCSAPGLHLFVSAGYSYWDGDREMVQDLVQGGDDLRKCFMRVKFLVLDEADRLLEPSFASELVVIANALPPKRQTLLFSATMTDNMTTLQSMALKDAYCFKVCALDRIPIIIVRCALQP